jgi:glycosyltransferase involved in cell wall biosynthesis
VTLRIGFSLDAQRLWMGGLSYYENLLSSVALVRKPDEHRLIAVVSGDTNRFGNLLRHFDEIYQLPDTRVIEKAKDTIAQILTSRKATAWLTPEATFSCHLRKHRVDVAFLTKDPLANFRVPKVCWFPDFQYLYYPEMFTPDDYKAYSRAATNIAKYADRIILNSNAVREDFLRVAPNHADKLLVLPFVAWIEDELYADNAKLVSQKYHLPEKFFYLPNQFWKHKNHKVVLDALVLAKSVVPDLVIVSSGILDDYRDRQYPSEFVASISSHGVRGCFILLGLIPRRHVYGLMRRSLAVLQPSLFEGWSSSIEEAKSLGKRIIASDIQVHREQNAPDANYFDPHNPQQLADLLVKHHREGHVGPEPEREQLARQSFLARAETFGRNFLALMSDVARK